MRAKMRGGPMNNKYYEVMEDWNDRLNVRKPKTEDYFNAARDPYAPMEFVDGHYTRSNMSLKNGAVIFIWMGWKE